MYEVYSFLFLLATPGEMGDAAGEPSLVPAASTIILRHAGKAEGSMKTPLVLSFSAYDATALAASRCPLDLKSLGIGRLALT